VLPMQPTKCDFCSQPFESNQLEFTADGRSTCTGCKIKQEGRPQMPGVVPPDKEYEFGIAENEVFSGLGSWMFIVAIGSIVFGALQGILGAMTLALVKNAGIEGFLTLAQGVVLGLIGAWLASASRAFRDLVRTEGNDVMLLMKAMKKLRAVYTVQGILMIIACVFVAITLVVLFSGSKVK
jgi:hypothetical protein